MEEEYLKVGVIGLGSAAIHNNNIQTTKIYMYRWFDSITLPGQALLRFICIDGLTLSLFQGRLYEVNQYLGDQSVSM